MSFFARMVPGSFKRMLRARIDAEVEQKLKDTVPSLVEERVRAALDERFTARPDLDEAKVREIIRAEIGFDSLLAKVCMISPKGDYVEFGAFRGVSISGAYWSLKRKYDRFLSGHFDHTTEDPGALKSKMQKEWDETRLIGFDSFEGFPEDGTDKVFGAGTYVCTEEQFLDNVRKAGVPVEKVVTVKGFFQDTLNAATRERIGLQRIAVAHIDSDLYESAALALEFIAPALVNGSVILFDEWFQYSANPALGEQRAFTEWKERHPEFVVTEYQTGGLWSKAFVVNRE